MRIYLVNPPMQSNHIHATFYSQTEGVICRISRRVYHRKRTATGVNTRYDAHLISKPVSILVEEGDIAC